MDQTRTQGKANAKQKQSGVRLTFERLATTRKTVCDALGLANVQMLPGDQLLEASCVKAEFRGTMDVSTRQSRDADREVLKECRGRTQNR